MVTVDGDLTDSEVVVALRTEVEGWRPRRVPDLVELTDRVAQPWRRSVMLASALGAVALAIVLLVSLAVVVAVPADIGWAGSVKNHLTHMP
jgi:hypothetical protein